MPEQPQYSDDQEIFLLMSQKNKQACGFHDAGKNRSFTFAFTTQDKAKNFLRIGRNQRFFAEIDLLFRMTVGEYFDQKAKGWTNSDLAIDPDPKMLRHPVMQRSLNQLC